jgi:hypothetical protein
MIPSTNCLCPPRGMVSALIAAYVSCRSQKQNRRRIVNPAAAEGMQVGGGYLAMRYTRSPAPFFEDSILTLCFLAAVEMNPRTLCACQSVAFMISARVAPLAHPIMSRIFAPLLSARGAAALRSGLWAFLPAVAPFLGAAALALFLALGAPFFRLVPLFEDAFSGATVAPGSATTAVSVASAFVMVVLLPFSLRSGAPDSSLRRPGKAREKETHSTSFCAEANSWRS